MSYIQSIVKKAFFMLAQILVVHEYLQLHIPQFLLLANTTINSSLQFLIEF